MTEDTRERPSAELLEFVHASLRELSAREREEAGRRTLDAAAVPALVDLYLLHALPEWAEALLEEHLAADARARAVLLEHAERFHAGQREIAWQALSEMLRLEMSRQIALPLLMATVLRPRHRRVARGEPGAPGAVSAEVPIVTPDGEAIGSATLRVSPAGEASGRYQVAFAVPSLPPAWQQRLSEGAVCLQVRMEEGWVTVPVEVRVPSGPRREAVVATTLDFGTDCREYELNLEAYRLAFAQ